MLTDRGHLLTEQLNPRSGHIDELSIEEAFAVINAEDRTVAEAVGRAAPAICAAVRCVAAALGAGGRLFYVGAGTSGRLGVIDAAECPPTFMTSPEMVQGLIAGGPQAMLRSIEGAEDSAEQAVADIAARGVGPGDAVMGIATGGTTPFVHAALTEARRRGARTLFLACVSADSCPDQADVSIRVLTGPEIVAGSTRLKAGTATKMVLNAISTLTMIQLGKVHGNLMVDLNRQACAKLEDRALRVVQQAAEVDRETAAGLLRRAGDVKTAIVMHRRAVDREVAQRLLQQAGGRVRAALNNPA
jgi:N-acetylmuramic acid 6-phosphate etherase